jgi:hypothetical protein
MNRDDRLSHLLRWYPRAWRQRYGDEFSVLLEDALGVDDPTIRFRTSVALAGLRERGHESGVIGSGRVSREQLRVGSLIVLGAWAMMVVAGLSLVKSAEHFAQVMPAASRHLAQVAYDVTAAAAIAATVLIVAGALFGAPSFVGFLRGGGWSRVKHQLVRVLVASMLSGVSLLGLKYWSLHLDAHARNGGNTLYTGAFVCFALIAVATLALWTHFAIQVARQLRLSQRVLRLESHLAEGVAGTMFVITLGAGLWWQQVGLHASWYLQGTPPGVAVYPVTPNLVLTSSMMVISSAIAMFGMLRIRQARRRGATELIDH